MSTFKKESTCAYEAVDAFGGIDHAALIGKLSEAWDIDNFRILADGSLQKRDGYALLCTFAAPIDAAQPCTDDDEHAFVLTGGSVWRVSVSDGEKRLIGRVREASDTHEVHEVSDAGGCFFCLDGQTYLLTGGSFSAVTRDELPASGSLGAVTLGELPASGSLGADTWDELPASGSLDADTWGELPASGSLGAVTLGELPSAEGYVPLYGRDWSQDGGSVFQPRNLLSRHVRLTYRLTAPSRMLRTGLSGFRIERLCIDGVETDAAEAAARGQYICLPVTLPRGASVEVLLLLDDLPDTAALLASRGAHTFGDAPRRIVCYGGSKDGRLFLSRPVTDAELTASQACRPAGTAVYFPDTDVIETGLRPEVSVTGNAAALLVSDRERSLLLTSDGRLRRLVGVPGADCDGVCIGHDAYTVSSRGLWRVDLRSGNGVRPVDGDRLPCAEDGRLVMGYDPRYSELSVASPSSERGEVLVLSLSGHGCYRFSGVGAQLWLRCGETLCFAADGGLFAFVPERGRDRVLGGEELPISASLVSRWSDMGLPDRPKRLRSLRLCSQGDEPFTLTLSQPSGTLAEVRLPGGDGSSLELHSRLLRTDRFEHVRLRLTCRGSGRQRIFGVALYATK